MESTSTIIKHAVMGAALATSAWACGSSAPTQELVDARRAYERAQVSPASQYTPDDLLTARQALDKAEDAHEDDPGSAKEAHLAYLAARRSQIATARGEMMQAKKGESKAKAQYHSALEANQGQLAETQSELEQARAAQSEAEADRQAALQRLSEVASVKEEQRGMVITLSGAVLFPSGGDTLSPVAQQSLDQVAEALKNEQGEGSIAIEGHTDSRGSTDLNDALSQKRAQAVANYLASRGLDRSRIEVVGRGENQPIASNDTTDGRASNRRVEIVLGGQRSATQGASFGATPTKPSTAAPSGAAAKTLPEEQRMEPKQPQQPRTQPPAPPADSSQNY